MVQINLSRISITLTNQLFSTLALYGVGAMISPKVSAYLLVHEYSWKGMYVFLALVALINIISITMGFYHVDFEEVKHEDGEGDEQGSTKPNHSELTKLAILNKVTLIGAAYILIYVGVEVTLGGWGFSWLTKGRHGADEPMLSVMSGYWAGLALGRVVLGYLCGRFGEKLMITLFTMMIIAGLVVMTVSTDIIIDSTGKKILRQCNK
jgi:fucose permease